MKSMEVTFNDGTERVVVIEPGANLPGAYLTGAYLAGADLWNANLTGAYLAGAYLTGADLRGADLTGAYLRGADLTGADLRGADLRGADLTGANLRGADLTGAKLPTFEIVPPTGAFRAWKKLDQGIIAELGIPADAPRTGTPIGRKCRASKVKVLAMYHPDGRPCEPGRAVDGYYLRGECYRVGEYTRADAFDPDIRVECTHGIHFFLTRAEAEAYDD